VYDHNEDALSLAPERGVFVVADGMGGHASGEVASRIAADAALAASAGGSLVEALVSAHRAVAQAAAADPARKGMGSTIVAAEVARGRARIAWVGDSRGYLWRDGRLSRLTRDHSLMNLLLDRAEVDAADVTHHPQRHVITQTLGHGDPRPAEVEVRLRAGDELLLCSDGLNDEPARRGSGSECDRRAIDRARARKGRPRQRQRRAGAVRP
jgi:protein phosphatase